MIADAMKIERLVSQNALDGGTTTWMELAHCLGILIWVKSQRSIYKLLAAVDRQRHRDGLPLLSPMIHGQKAVGVKPALVKLLGELGLLRAGDDPVEVVRELQRRFIEQYQYSDEMKKVLK